MALKKKHTTEQDSIFCKRCLCLFNLFVLLKTDKYYIWGFYFIYLFIYYIL